jgi:hypothetical protein
MNITLNINGKSFSSDVEPRLLLIHYVREVVGLTGPHIGCETSLCGACTVEVDGKAVKSCTMFAVQADGAKVLTIEGSGHQWQAPCDAGSLLERTWRSVRILYAGDDHGVQTDSRSESSSHRRRNPARPRRQRLPLHGISAHRQRAQAARPPLAKPEEHNHGHHHYQNRKTGRPAHPPARRSAPDHRHGDVRGRHQDAGDALRGAGAQPACGGEHPIDRHQQGGFASGRGRGFTGKDTEAWGRCPVAHRCPGCAFRIITFWRPIACISLVIPSRWWSPPTAILPPTRRIWWKSIMKF